MEKIRFLISDELGVEESEVLPDSHLREDLNAEPLSLADLMVKIEKNFSVKIPEGQSTKFETVADIADFVSDQIGDI